MTADSDSSFDALLREAAELRVPTEQLVRPPDLGEVLENKYRIDAKLGEGGMGAVFRAQNLENGKQVAVKWLLDRSPKACARFIREAQVAAQIDHPNVVNVFDVGSHRGGRYLVMELLHGSSLGARVRAGKLAPGELVAIMLPVLRGLDAAHAAGVIHRDLKPDNVFLCIGRDAAPREPKVLDFGISKLRTEPCEEARLTSEGSGLGTLAYMSPEQLVDAPNVDERTDIYAAGVMMYEALVGRLPFQADSHNAWVLAIAAQKPVPLRALDPTIPSALERIVMRAMAKDACDRQPSAQALIAELAHWQSETMRAPASNDVVPAIAAARPNTARYGRWLSSAALVAASVLAWWLSERPAHAPTQRVYVGSERAAALEAAPAARSHTYASESQREEPERASLQSLEPVPSAGLARRATLPSPPDASERRAVPRERAASRAGAIRLSDL